MEEAMLWCSARRGSFRTDYGTYREERVVAHLEEAFVQTVAHTERYVFVVHVEEAAIVNCSAFVLEATP
jgi:hypothetical protein